MNKPKGKLFVISAPSGAGKSSLIQKILKNSSNIELSISATTRLPRDGEEEGKHYFFMKDDEFNKLKSENAFIEHALVHNYQYATLRSYIQERLDQGISIICDIDVQGYVQIKQASIDHVSIFIIPPSLEELKNRLMKRGSDSDAVIRTRLKNAKEELKFAEEFDYRILNEDYDLAYKDMKDIVIDGKSIDNRDKINLKILRDMLS